MDLQLTDKHVLITGASRGIGLAVVRAFRAEGAVVTATARHSSPELDATGAHFVAADLSTPDGPEHLLSAVLAERPELDVLVNNAGGGTIPDHVLTDPFGGQDADWESTFALNLYAAVRTARAALPALTRSRGALINLGSDSALRPHSAPLPYSAAKAALNAFSRGLAEQVAASGVRVNVVTPSATRTPLLTGDGSFIARMAAEHGADPATLWADFAGQNGMLTGELIDPEEIARVIVLLSSPTLPSAVGSNWALHAGALKMPA